MAAARVGWVREPAVAGRFYSDDPAQLRRAVRRHLGADGADGPAGSSPAALIAPHAGYRYSGPTAGAGWATLAGAEAPPERVVLVGPSHRVPVGGPGVGVSSATAWRTPLGDVPLDGDAAAALVDQGVAVVADDAHAPEHSLEVHLPFLLEALGPVPVVPLVIGRCPAEAAAAALRAAVGRRRHRRGGVVRPEPLPARRRRPGPATTAPSAPSSRGVSTTSVPRTPADAWPSAALLLAARSHGIAPSLARRGHVGRRGR